MRVSEIKEGKKEFERKQETERQGKKINPAVASSES